MMYIHVSSHLYIVIFETIESFILNWRSFHFTTSCAKQNNNSLAVWTLNLASGLMLTATVPGEFVMQNWYEERS